MDKIILGSHVLPLLKKYIMGVQHIYIVSPFLSATSIREVIKILEKKQKVNLTLITKWEPLDLLLEYSDIDVFELLYQKNKYIKWNIKIHISQNLHAKVILLGKSLGIIGSMNLTKSGLNINSELGVSIIDDDYKLDVLEKRIKEIYEKTYELSYLNFL